MIIERSAGESCGSTEEEAFHSAWREGDGGERRHLGASCTHSRLMRGSWNGSDFWILRKFLQMILLPAVVMNPTAERWGAFEGFKRESDGWDQSVF